MGSKYEMTDITTEYYDTTLHRIRALKSFNGVKEGDIGGWIEDYENLNQYGNCWVYGNAHVRGNAQVYSDAQVRGKADVSGRAQVCGKARVDNYALVLGDAVVGDNARVYDYARVCGCARLFDDAQVFGNAQVSGYSIVCDNVKVFGNALVYGNAMFYKNARIRKTADYLVIGPIGSEEIFTTFMRGNGNKILVRCGCFSGGLDEFVKRVTKTHGNNQYGKIYRSAIELAKIQLLRGVDDGNFEL